MVCKAIEIHRLRRPHCMGTLYWQLNDCWPVASWSSIDYYGNWKAMHYAVKKSFAPVIVVPHMVKPLTYDLYLVSDQLQDLSGKMIATAYTVQGELIGSDTMECVATANSSVKVAQWMPKNHPKLAENGYLKLQFIDDLDEVVAEKITTFDKPKYLKNNPEVQMETQQADGGWKLTLTSDAFVQGVQIYTQPYVSGKYSDNYITLEPHKPLEIFFTSATKDSVNFKLRY